MMRKVNEIGEEKETMGAAGKLNLILSGKLSPQTNQIDGTCQVYGEINWCVSSKICTTMGRWASEGVARSEWGFTGGSGRCDSLYAFFKETMFDLSGRLGQDKGNKLMRSEIQAPQK